MRFASSSLLLFLLTHPAAAQTLRTFTPVAELTIDAATADLNGAGTLAVARDGTMLISQMSDKQVTTFSADGRRGTIGRDGEGPGEFRRPTRLGMIGDTVWVLDPDLNRATLFRTDGKFVRSFPLPMSGYEKPQNTWNALDRTADIFVQAILPGGTLRVLASMRGSLPAAQRPAWAAGADSGSSLWLAMLPDGTVRSRIAAKPRETCYVNYEAGKSRGSVRIPYCFSTITSDWDGGTDVGLVEAVPGGAPRYRVSLHGIDGRLRFTTEIGYTPVPVTSGGLDSARVQLTRLREQISPDLRTTFPTVTPRTTYPPVRRLVVGRDGSVWIEEAGRDTAHRWRIYDVRGTAVGTVTLPADVSIATAELERIWAFTTDTDGLLGVVRYRLR